MGITFVPSLVTVVFEELKGSPVKVLTLTEGFSVTRRLKCVWDSADLLASELLGGPIASAGSTLEDMVVKLPDIFPGNPSIRVDKVTISPFFSAEVQADPSQGTGTNVAKYDNAELLVEYGPFAPTGEFQAGKEEKMDERVESNSEFLIGPPDGICWNQSSDVSTREVASNRVQLGKLIVGFDWILRRERMPSVVTQMLTSLGRVNSNQIVARSINFTIEAETLLYKSCSMQRGFTIQGIPQWDITNRFSWRGGDGATWNLFWRFDKNKWSPLFSCSQQIQIKPYTPIDFTGLVG